MGKVLESRPDDVLDLLVKALETEGTVVTLKTEETVKTAQEKSRDRGNCGDLRLLRQ